MKSSGEKIGKLRKRTGDSQGEFGAKLGVSQSTVSGWEVDTSAPKLDMLPRVAQLLGCTIDYLLDETDEREPEEVEAEMRVRGQASHVGWPEIERRVIVNAGAGAQQKISAPAPVGEAEAEKALNITIREDLRGFNYPEIRRKGRTPKTDPETSGRKDQ